MDRVGLGWRPELGAAILSHLDRIDIVEVMADDLVLEPRRIPSIQTLTRHVPVTLHGVALGLASAVPVSQSRLDALARVVEKVGAESWSEHLAFVRGDGIEIGHLAAPPRTRATIDGAVANIARARRAVGSMPMMENVATLIEPPGSVLPEAGWIASIQRESGCPLLLDLNNLHANAVNFQYAIDEFLRSIDVDRVGLIHIAGGKWVQASTGERRLLDDHRHDVPEAVFHLLEEVGSRTSRSLTVVLERDGRFPDFALLLDQLDRARAALAKGRARSTCPAAALVQRTEDLASEIAGRSMTGDGAAVEALLARLYVDAGLRGRFIESPADVARLLGMKVPTFDQLGVLDLIGLELAGRSFDAKRRERTPRSGPPPS